MDNQKLLLAAPIRKVGSRKGGRKGGRKREGGKNKEFIKNEKGYNILKVPQIKIEKVLVNSCNI